MIGPSLAAGTVGLTGLFAARAFVPMFAAALTLRFAPEVGWVAEWGLLRLMGGEAVPSWFTADETLVVLGVLALVEILAHKSSEARQLLTLVDQYAKPLAALLTYLGILSLTEAEILASLLGGSGTAYGLGSVLVAGGTFLVAAVHNGVLESAIELDEDDDTGALGLLSWAQDGWSLFGIVLLILFPLVMVTLIVLAIGFIFALRKAAESLEENAKATCEECGATMYRAALSCPACSAPNPSPAELSWLGTATRRTASNRSQQPLLLASYRRCRRCATRLPRRSVDQACPACGTGAFDSAEFAAAYDRAISERLASVLVVCACLSLVPVVGLIPGVIYYRLALVAPYRRYLERGRRLLLKIGMWICFLFLILFQWVPIVGGAVVPIMALVSYRVYRGAFLKRIRNQATAPEAPDAEGPRFSDSPG